jgi:hypothetical protein
MTFLEDTWEAFNDGLDKHRSFTGGFFSVGSRGLKRLATGKTSSQRRHAKYDKESRQDYNDSWNGVLRCIAAHPNSSQMRLHDVPTPTRLCEVCAVAAKALLKDRRGISPDMPLRCFSDMTANSACTLCSFVVNELQEYCTEAQLNQLYSQRQPMRMVYAKDFHSFSTLALEVHTADQQRSVLPVIEWQRRFADRHSGFYDLNSPVEFDSDLSEIETHTGRGRDYHMMYRVYDEREALHGSPNIPLIQSWMTHCESHHDCVQPSTAQPPDLQLINVAQRRVVAAPPKSRWITLSYVWGDVARDPTGGLSQEGALPIKLHGTLEDALRLTYLLGEKYLWIDIFCIDQQNLERKLAQIKRMDQIFANAALCIVAISSETSANGIPGIGCSAGPRQTMFPPNTPLLLSTAHSSTEEILLNCPWSTRGWTFQEELLSRRRLYMSNQQYWLECYQCKYSSVFEGSQSRRIVDVRNIGVLARERGEPGDSLGVIEEKRRRTVWPAQLRQTQENDVSKSLHSRRRRAESEERYAPKEAFSLSSYFGMVRHYVTRQLSYQADILQALTGITSRLESANGLTFETGLPSHLLVESMCWQPEKAALRRAGFPTWSWAGWMVKPRWEDVERHAKMSHNIQDNYDGPRKSDVQPDDFVFHPRSVKSRLVVHSRGDGHLHVSSVVARFQCSAVVGEDGLYAIHHQQVPFRYSAYSTKEWEDIEAHGRQRRPDSTFGTTKILPRSTCISLEHPHRKLFPHNEQGDEPGTFRANEQDISSCRAITATKNPNSTFEAEFLLMIRTRSSGPSPLMDISNKEYNHPARRRWGSRRLNTVHMFGFTWALMIIREGDIVARRAAIVCIPSDVWQTAPQGKEELALV